MYFTLTVADRTRSLSCDEAETSIGFKNRILGKKVEVL